MAVSFYQNYSTTFSKSVSGAADPGTPYTTVSNILAKSFTSKEGGSIPLKFIDIQNSNPAAPFYNSLASFTGGGIQCTVNDIKNPSFFEFRFSMACFSTGAVLSGNLSLRAIRYSKAGVLLSASEEGESVGIESFPRLVGATPTASTNPTITMSALYNFQDSQVVVFYLRSLPANSQVRVYNVVLGVAAIEKQSLINLNSAASLFK